MPTRKGSDSPTGSFRDVRNYLAKAAAHEHPRHQHRRPVLGQAGQACHPHPLANPVGAQQPKVTGERIFDPGGPVESSQN